MRRPLVLVGPLPPMYVGQSISFEMLVNGVRERGIPCAVVDLSSRSRSVGIRSRWRRVLELGTTLWPFVRAVARRPRTFYLTIAQSRQGFLRDLPMIWVSWLFRHRIILHLKGGNYDGFYYAQPWWIQSLIRATIRRADRILVLGEGLRPMFRFEPAVQDRIRVVANGLPMDPPPSGVAAGSTYPAEPRQANLRVLFLSNLIATKGYFELLRALRVLIQERGWPSLQADFCGLFLSDPHGGTESENPRRAREVFEAYIEENGLEANVTYHGAVSGDEKKEMLSRSHVFVLPTRYSSEGQPVSIIEALAFGLPCISTDYRAIPDLVEDRVNGVLLSSTEPEAIADAIEWTLSDQERYRALSEAAVNRFRSCFTKEAHLDRLLRELGWAREEVES